MRPDNSTRPDGERASRDRASLPRHDGGLTRRRAARILVVACVVLLAPGCFEPPIEDVLTLAFDAAGDLAIRLETEFHRPTGDAESRAFAARLADEIAARAGGWHDWNRAFDAVVTPAENGESFAREEERLIEHRLWASVEAEQARDALGNLFAETAIQVDLSATPTDEGLWRELVFLPISSRATRGERRRVERQMQLFSEAVATYLERSVDVWRYLEARPDRARRCLAELFDTREDTREHDQTELSPEEEALLAAVDDSTEALTAIFELGEGEAYTWHELSMRVWDPFPARVRVELPVAPSEVEGLVDATAWDPPGDGATTLVVPERSMWSAFDALEGRWLSPDPVLMQVRALQRADDDGELPDDGLPEEELDLDAILALPFFWAEPPSPEEVETALRDELERDAFYRVLWLEPGRAPSGLSRAR